MRPFAIKLVRLVEPGTHVQVDAVVDAMRLTAFQRQRSLGIAKCFSLVSDAGCCIASSRASNKERNEIQRLLVLEVVL